MRVSIRKKIFAFVVIPRRSSKRWIVEWSFARNVIVTQLYTFTISRNVETIINFVTSSQGDKLNKDEYVLSRRAQASHSGNLVKITFRHFSFLCNLKTAFCGPTFQLLIANQISSISKTPNLQFFYAKQRKSVYYETQFALLMSQPL